MSTRIKCLRCDHMILDVTAKLNNGLCQPCRTQEKTRAFEAIVAGWIKNPGTLPGTNGNPEPTDLALAIRAAQIRDQRIPGVSKEAVCHRCFDAAIDRWYIVGSADLTEKEKTVLSVETFFGETTNGGFVQFLTNESQAFANWAADGLDRIGLPEYAVIMRKVQGLFPDGIIPQDSDEPFELQGEIEVIEAGFWKLYHANRTEFRDKLYEYIINH